MAKKEGNSFTRSGGEPSSAQYKSAIAGLTAPFIVVTLLFVCLAVYLFVAYPDRPAFGCVFIGIAAVVAALYVVMLVVLKKKAAAAARREKGGQEQNK